MLQSPACGGQDGAVNGVAIEKAVAEFVGDIRQCDGVDPINGLASDVVASTWSPAALNTELDPPGLGPIHVRRLHAAQVSRCLAQTLTASAFHLVAASGALVHVRLAAMPKYSSFFSSALHRFATRDGLLRRKRQRVFQLREHAHPRVALFAKKSKRLTDVTGTVAPLQPLDASRQNLAPRLDRLDRRRRIFERLLCAPC